MGQRKKPVAKKEKEPQVVVGQHEFFTPWRLILFFAIIELGIILLMKDNFRIRYYGSKARSSFESGDYSQAEHYWRKLQKIAPYSSTVNLELGQTYYKLGEYTRAIGCFQIVLNNALHSGEETTHINTYLGLCYQKLGEPTTALKFFKDELMVNPTDVHANFYVGKALFENKQYAEAAAHFQRIANNPTYQEELQQYWAKIEKEILGS